MRTKRGQGTTEYLIFACAITFVFICFYIIGFQRTGKSSRAPALFPKAVQSLLQMPGEAITNMTMDSTRLDIYENWPSSGPGVTYINFGTPWSWTDNQVGWTAGCDTSSDTCSTMEANSPPKEVNQGCYPGLDYDCHEVWCWWGNTLQFDKHCHTAAVLIDTCPNSDEFSFYSCQPSDDFTCNDIAVDIGCVAADVPGGCWQEGITYFTRQRTIRCTPILL